MADVTAGPDGTREAPYRFRPNRVYLGWQYALLAADPGPPPRRPTPPEQEQLNPEWVAAQRREENALNRPLKAACAACLVFTAALVAFWIMGPLSGLIAGFGILICLAGAAFSGYAVWQGEQALRSRIAEERQRLGKIRAEQESRLFAWQEEHKRRFQEWQRRRAAYDGQRHWYAVSLPDTVDRVDVAGGTLAGWSGLSTVIGASRLAAGGEVTVIDLSEGAAAADLVSVAQRAGIDPLVWVLPADLPMLDVGSGLGKQQLADVLSLVVNVSEEHATTRDLSYDNAILERVLDVLGEDAAVAAITAALRALAQVGDPREDVRRGLIQAGQLERLATMFGRGAADRIVIERAWAMESQLRKLENLGTTVPGLAPARLRVLATDRRAGVFGNKVLGTFVVTALTHMLRQAASGQPWQHTVFLLGAEKLRADVLDRLSDACEATRSGLVVAYRSIPPHVKQRLGRGNAAVAYMRLGNAEDASAASEQIGSEHRFVLSQLTETIGTEVSDSTGESYTSTVGTADSVSTSVSVTETEGRSRGRGRSQESVLTPFGRTTRSRSRDASHSHAVSDSDALTEGITTSTAWGVNTARALGRSQSLARGSARSREFLVEQHELQQLPPSAVIITHAAAEGRHIVLADVNPAILAFPTATLLGLDEARSRPPQARAAAALRPEPAAAGRARNASSQGAPGGGRPGAGGPGAGGSAHGSAAAGAGWQPRTPPDAGWQGAGSNSGTGVPVARPGDPAGATGREVPDGVEAPRPRAAQEEDDREASGAAPTESPDAADAPAEERERPSRSPVSWQGEDQPPPNLGPPPARLDWRRKPRDGS